MFNVFKSNDVDSIVNIESIEVINTYDDLIDLLNTAYTNNTKIRVIGGGWNWNGLCFGESNTKTIRLGEEFNSFEFVDNDSKVKIGGAVLIASLQEELINRKLEIESFGYCINKDVCQTVGGLCATNTHHSGINPFSETCESIEVVVYDGDNKDNEANGAIIKTFNRGDPDYKMFFGSIGSFGIITNIITTTRPLRIYKPKILRINNDQDLLNYMETPNSDIWLATNLSYRWKITAHTRTNQEIESPNIPFVNFNENILLRFGAEYISPKFNLKLFRIINNIITYFFEFNNLIHTYEIQNRNDQFFHIEMEFLFQDLVQFMDIINSFNLNDDFMIVFRLVPSYTNSIIPFDGPTYTAGIHNLSNDLERSDKVYNMVCDELHARNIKFIPHTGKFISSDPKWSKWQSWLSTQEFDEYQNIKQKYDPKGLFNTRLD